MLGWIRPNLIVEFCELEGEEIKSRQAQNLAINEKIHNFDPIKLIFWLIKVHTHEIIVFNKCHKDGTNIFILPHPLKLNF